MIFARTFNFPVPGKESVEAQVLVTKGGYNDEKDAYELKISTQIDNTMELFMNIELTMGFDTEEKMVEAFDNYTDEAAKKMRLLMEDQTIEALGKDTIPQLLDLLGTY